MSAPAARRATAMTDEQKKLLRIAAARMLEIIRPRMADALMEKKRPDEAARG